MVTPKENIHNFNDFEDEVRRTWTLFNNTIDKENYDIEDFIDFHNDNSKLIIKSVVSDFIQL